MKYLVLLLLVIFCSFCANAQSVKDSAKILKMQAPDSFQVQFNTTQGAFILEVYKAWSPKAADRLFQLVQTGQYNGNYVFRATDKYVQFGIGQRKDFNGFWEKHGITDEPVLHSNMDSIVSFATGGANNRTAQIFINMQNNTKLDTISFRGVKGFPPVGKIIAGMENIRKFNKQYGDEIAFKHQDSILAKGNEYLIKNFPGLDIITDAVILKKP